MSSVRFSGPRSVRKKLGTMSAFVRKIPTSSSTYMPSLLISTRLPLTWLSGACLLRRLPPPLMSI